MRLKLTDSEIKQCNDLLGELIDLHEVTNPAKGKASEKDKNHNAHLAIQKAGLLTGILTSWAEEHFMGVSYKLQLSEDGLVNEENSNSHENECMFSPSEIEKLPEDVFYGEEGLSAYRGGIARILKNSIGVGGVNWGWRDELQTALYALNEGQIESLTTPLKTTQKGKAYDLQNIKWAVTKHVYILEGEGWKKTAARQNLAENCNVSHDAIKKWEKDSLEGRCTVKELEAIKIGAIMLHKLKDNGFSQDKSISYLTIENQKSKEESWSWMTGNMINVLMTKKKYPLENLKEMLESAGLRSTGTKP